VSSQALFKIGWLECFLSIYTLSTSSLPSMARTKGSRKSVQKIEEIAEDNTLIAYNTGDDSDSGLKSEPTKKPRKKSQAFGVPKTAALKAK
jgi:hypothetical protein